MIYLGTDLKYRVTATMAGFSMDEDAFVIVIKDRYGRVARSLTLADMLMDGQGRYYFTLPRVIAGPYYAYFTAARADGDYASGRQNTVDGQLLVVVGSENRTPCQCCKADGMTVTYERVWSTTVGTQTFLTEADGTPILDGNGNRIFLAVVNSSPAGTRLDMTGDEFKTLIEGRSDDSRINTVPEVLDVMQGLDEDTELTVMTNQDVDDMMGRVLGTGTSSE